MRNSHTMRNLCRLLILSIALGTLAALPLLSSAHSANSINIVNNSNRTIRYVYLSHVDADDWTGNQIGESTIGTGQSYTLNNVSCDQQQIKVIGEDVEGCFVSGVVACQANATWTITNATAADCGN
jgi:hypothetical protein